MVMNSTPKSQTTVPQVIKLSKISRSDLLRKVLPADAFLELQDAEDLTSLMPLPPNCFYLFGFRVLKLVKSDLPSNLEWAIFRWVQEKKTHRITYTVGMGQWKVDEKIDLITTSMAEYLSFPSSGVKGEKICDEDLLQLKLRYMVNFEAGQNKTAFFVGNVPEWIKLKFDQNTTWINCFDLAYVE